jgi:O-acetylserine/cysteine efflux transporter
VKPLHLAAALLMVSFWGFNFVVIKWGLDDMPPLTQGALRFALATIPAVFLVPRPKVRWQLLVGYGLFAFAGQFSLLMSGMAAGLPAGLASVVIQLQVFFTIGLAMLLTHERPRAAQVIGALLAGGGVLLVAMHLPSGSRLGLVLVMLAAVSWAVANTIVKRIPVDAAAGAGGPLSIVVWACAVATVPLTLAALIVDGPAQTLAVVRQLGALQWTGLAFQAWPTTLLAFALWAWLLRLYPAALIAPFALLVPIIGMASAVVFLDEAITWWKLAGGALVLAGLALNVLTYRSPQARGAPAR